MNVEQIQLWRRIKLALAHLFLRTNDSFPRYLKIVLESRSNTHEELALINALGGKKDEDQLTKYFMDWLAKAPKISGVGKPACKKAKGFFDWSLRPDDVQCCYNDKLILIECKVLRDTRQYEVRDSFTQLFEYLVFSKSNGVFFDEGCVVIFEERNSCTPVFDGEKKSLPSIFKCHRMWNGRRIKMSAMRIYLNNNKLQAEMP